MTIVLSNREALLEVLLALNHAERRLIALAGAPAAGKSTLSRWLEQEINRHRPGSAAVLAMDGFHFDDGVLKEKGTLSRKGAPFTFDVAGLAVTLDRLRSREPEVAVPVFDRTLELSRAGGEVIGDGPALIIVEGNYLLVREAPWAQVREKFDASVTLRIGLDILEQRLRARWRSHGYSAEQINRKVFDNDLPNARYVMSNSDEADYVLDAAAM